MLFDTAVLKRQGCGSDSVQLRFSGRHIQHRFLEIEIYRLHLLHSSKAQIRKHKPSIKYIPYYPVFQNAAHNDHIPIRKLNMQYPLQFYLMHCSRSFLQFPPHMNYHQFELYTPCFTAIYESSLSCLLATVSAVLSAAHLVAVCIFRAATM